MADVRPFRALRPHDAVAHRVIAPPYDVLSEAQARAIAENRHSFVRITRPEVDLPEGTDAHSDTAYAQARTTLNAFVADGIVVRDAVPTYYFYGQQMGEHSQVGVIAGASVAEYDDGRIAKHEYTRPDKEDDRTHHMAVLGAQVGLVFLTHRPTAALAQITAEVTQRPPAWSTTTEDGVVHTLWLSPPELVEPIRAAFGEVERLYIADGHHRSAAASRIHAQRGDDASAHFLAGLYPSDRLHVMAYNRVVHDLAGHDGPAAFLAAVRAAGFDVEPTAAPTPSERGKLTMYLAGRWYALRPGEALRSDDPVAGLDVSVLQDHVLAPLLGIDDPRRSTRISFVGGIHGHAALAEAVDAGAAVAFHLYPTGLDQLFDVADAGRVMPPKSTWFEPKLREGVLIRSL
ncbi:MAG: hypothetical protein ACI8PZ_003243 [Myxococcota bacterium]|jgi:uncharacterized protein (DUF1015 family)